MDDGSRKPDDGADGWVDPHAPTEFGMEAVSGPPAGNPQTAPHPPHPQPPYPPHSGAGTTQGPQYPMTKPAVSKNSVEDGKAMAMLSHSSVLLGMPLFVIPMLQRENDFALHHSKAAAVNFIFFVSMAIVTVVTCGLAFPLLFLAYIPMVVGAVNAANGQLAGPWAWGRSGERMFPGLQRRDDDRQLLP